MNLNELFAPQKELDQEIKEKHNLEGQDLKKRKILAGIVELAETANEGRWFKFWSKDQKARTYEVNLADMCTSCNGNPVYYEGKKISRFCEKCDGVGYHFHNPLLEEYVDTIHFTITIALEYGYTEHTYKQPISTDLTDRALDIVYLLSSLPYVQRKVRFNQLGLIFDYIIALGYQFGFDEEMVLTAYYDKNKINHERQANNY